MLMAIVGINEANHAIPVWSMTGGDSELVITVRPPRPGISWGFLLPPQ